MMKLQTIQPFSIQKTTITTAKPYKNRIGTISFQGNTENPKQVAFISFETVPINKTGGMSDVVGELALELNKKGMDVRTIIPLLNAADTVPKNEYGHTIYKTPNGKEFLIDDTGIDFNYTYGTENAQGRIYKVNDKRVKYPVYVLHCPYDVSKNATEYQGWIMDQVKNQEAFSNASISALKKINNNTEKFNPKYVMAYEWTTLPIIEAMNKDDYYKNKIKIANMNNMGPVYQGRAGAPVVAPYILSQNEFAQHCNNPKVQVLLKEINKALQSRAIIYTPITINNEISHKNYQDAYKKIAQNYEKIIPYTTNHLGFLDKFLLEEFPQKGWFNKHYNFCVPALRAADAIVACSDTYIKELSQENRYSDGLANIMNLSTLKNYGITIGMDYSLYNPAASEEETTKPIKYPFSVNSGEIIQKPHLLNYKNGKKKNKEYLQYILSAKNKNGEINSMIGAKQYGYLDQDSKMFVTTLITRYDPQQKGIDIAIDTARLLLKENKDIQIILAGPGYNADRKLIKEYLELVKKYPGRAVLCDGFINNISQFYAGADANLIPSRFAPFELVQLQGMRMGAVPIASNCGGLAEIIKDNRTTNQEKSLGFKTDTSLLLSDNPEQEYYKTIKRALKVYKDKPELWNNILKNCLEYKREWDKPAEQYIQTVFNEKNYNNIKELFYVDNRYAAGSISNGHNTNKDLTFLAHKGYTQIIQLDKYDKNIAETAKKYGLKYKYIPTKNLTDEATIVSLLKEIYNNNEKVFFNEKQGGNTNSILASYYMAYSTNDFSNSIINKIWTERSKVFKDTVSTDADKIMLNLQKLSILGYKNAHNIKLLDTQTLQNYKITAEDNNRIKNSEFLQYVKETMALKQAVYSGRHYIK